MLTMRWFWNCAGLRKANKARYESRTVAGVGVWMSGGGCSR